jgi:ribosomal protein S18 acetylase RimI-like enzyme
MEIVPYRAGEGRALFGYWQAVGKSIPYFYPATFEAWQRCLLADRLAGEPLFQNVETGYALAGGRIVGMVQYGQPYFTWDAEGGKIYQPAIGVVRHLYFPAERPEVGEALLAWAAQGLGQLAPQHAFFHGLGMGCNAYHGKLHTSMAHVGSFLVEHGFEVEHENAFYALDLAQAGWEMGEHLALEVEPGAHESHFWCRQGAETIGSATLRYLRGLTGGATRDVVYMTWFGIDAAKRRWGLGRQFMALLVGYLLGQGYRWLHLDTASHNLGAQCFYDDLGFHALGTTRSYIRHGGNKIV